MFTIGPQILMFLPVAKYVIQLMQTLHICINVEAITYIEGDVSVDRLYTQEQIRTRA